MAFVLARTCNHRNVQKRAICQLSRKPTFWQTIA